MKRLSVCSPDSLQDFLQAQSFRYSKTRTVYRCVLRDFQKYVLKHSSERSPDLSVIERWLKERVLQWPRHMICHRARLVDRYLQWLESRGAIASNPLGELRRVHGHRTAPIIRALVSDDVEAALQRLRPPPAFASFLGKLMEGYVRQMRSAGYRYDTHARILLRFDRFLQSHPELSDAPLPQLVEAWSAVGSGPLHLYEAQQAGRLVSKAMHRLDARVPVLPPVSVDVCRRARQQQRRPHIYTEAEIQRVFRAARTLPSPKAPLRPLSLYTMLVLAYCVGLRHAEIASLTVADVHADEGIIEIRESKFFKSRRLPVTPSVTAALKQYLAAREKSGAPAHPASGLFWNETRHRPYAYGSIGNLLAKVLHHAALKPQRGRVGPRLHDFRHAMVCHRMRAWYREGINPQSRLQYLATYLGHRDISSTLVYLSATQELLHEANRRFRRHGVSALNAGGSQP